MPSQRAENNDSPTTNSFPIMQAQPPLPQQANWQRPLSILLWICVWSIIVPGALIGLFFGLGALFFGVPVLFYLGPFALILLVPGLLGLVGYLLGRLAYVLSGRRRGVGVLVSLLVWLAPFIIGLIISLTHASNTTTANTAVAVTYTPTVAPTVNASTPTLPTPSPTHHRHHR
jgi:4-amino-4-deoxy-L-arabinose transferase-like glycosyltransferase